MSDQGRFDDELSILEKMILSKDGVKKQYVTRLPPTAAWLLIMDCRDRNCQPGGRIEEIIIEYYSHPDRRREWAGGSPNPNDPQPSTPQGAR